MPEPGDVNQAAPSPADPPATVPLVSTLRDHPRMATILPRYLAAMPGILAEIELARRQNDRATLVRITHQLRGTGTMYGFPDLTRVAGECEQLLRSALDENPIAQQLDELQALLRRIAM